jgi:FlaA1/EpsC-like NDP-sugar epimerase
VALRGKEIGRRQYNMRFEEDGCAEQLTLWHNDVRINSTAMFGQDNKGSEARGITVGNPLYRSILFLGDLFLIVMAGCMGPLLRLGIKDTIADVIGFAWMLGITVVLLPLILYVFDLYNSERGLRKWEMAGRSGVAISFGLIVSIFILYLLPLGSYGRGVMAVQWALLWIFLNAWRWVNERLFRRTFQKIPVLIIGAGSCGKALSDLLKSPLSPYEVKGFLDDDPTKFGTTL